MTWVRIEPEFPDHPKIHAVGPTGLALQVRAICYCARHLTDGFVSTATIARLTYDMDLGAKGMTRIMVGARLWDPAKGGVIVHDFLDYNPSREMVTAERATRREITVRGGIARVMKAQREANGTFVASSRESSMPAGSALVPCIQQESSPVPDPVRDRVVVTPKIQSDPRASRSTRRVKSKGKKPGSFGRL